jgi:hypothetical protein
VESPYIGRKIAIVHDSTFSTSARVTFVADLFDNVLGVPKFVILNQGEEVVGVFVRAYCQNPVRRPNLEQHYSMLSVKVPRSDELGHGMKSD